ncbi:MAG: hypothetical protein FRX49_05093 [Trebouxia sp. A1-2]|nr:MAG: hypothetical protein FRX49_05093 [Trebouxia sp. A1-2]
MANFVSPLSIRTLLQDVNTSPSNSPEGPSSMLDEAVMNRAYYMGLQSSQPTASPLPLEIDPLSLAGPLDNMASVTDNTNAATAAAAAANFNFNPMPALAFDPNMNIQPEAPPAVALPVPAAEWLLRNSSDKAIKGRASPTSPTKMASRLERKPPAKLTTRAMPRSPSTGPHTPASREAATVFSRALPHSPGVRASSPTVPSKDEIQDGRWCEPRRCSCCWASSKASGLGVPTWRKGSIAPFVDLTLCNACGIFEVRHGKSLLDCSKPVRVLTGLKYAEAHRPSLHHSSPQLATNLVATRGSSGQGCSTSVYPSSPTASANLVDMSRGEPGQGRNPSVESSLPQGLPLGGILKGSAEGLGKAASLPLSPAAAPQLTRQHAPATLGTATQRDRNVSFGESSTANSQQLTTDQSSSFGAPLAKDTRSDSQPLSTDCVRSLSSPNLKDSSASAGAAVTKASKKRAAEVSSAEPNAKQLIVSEGANAAARRRSSGGQGTTAAGGAFGVVGEATADVDGDGDSTMADGESSGQGRRRTVRLRKKSIATAVEDQLYHGGEDASLALSDTLTA